MKRYDQTWPSAWVPENAIRTGQVAARRPRRESLQRTRSEIVNPMQNSSGMSALSRVISVGECRNRGTRVNGNTMKFMTRYTITP